MNTTSEAEQPKPRHHANPKVIAIASGKGGVGKTWFSITLAHWLAKQGKKALLFDSDLGLANVDIQLGLMPDKDLGAVVSQNADLSNAAVHYEEGGFDIIAGRSGSGALAALPASRLAEMRQDLMKLAKNYDHTIVDLGAGVERSIRATAKEADTTFIVTNDEPTSLTDAYTFIKVTLADDPTADIRIVINRAHSRQEGERTYQTLLKACTGFLKYEPPLAGVIRHDKRVAESIRMQAPILKRFPNSDAADDVELIARSITSQSNQSQSA